MSSIGDPEVFVLQSKIRNLEHWARELARDKFHLEHRVRNLTRSLGFNSLQDAEESQSLQRGIPSAAALDSDLRPVTGPALSVHDVDSYLKRITQVEEEAQQARDEATRCAREVELLNLDLKRLTADNRSLSTSLQESRANIEEYEREKLNMREEFAERLTLKDGAITDLKKMLAEASASRLDMPVIPSPRPPAKENRSLADISSHSNSPTRRTDAINSYELLDAQYANLKDKFEILVLERDRERERSKTMIGEWKIFKAWLLNSIESKASAATSSIQKKRPRLSSTPVQEKGNQTGVSVPGTPLAFTFTTSTPGAPSSTLKSRDVRKRDMRAVVDSHGRSSVEVLNELITKYSDPGLEESSKKRASKQRGWGERNERDAGRQHEGNYVADSSIASPIAFQTNSSKQARPMAGVLWPSKLDELAADGSPAATVMRTRADLSGHFQSPSTPLTTSMTAADISRITASSLATPRILVPDSSPLKIMTDHRAASNLPSRPVASCSSTPFPSTTSASDGSTRPMSFTSISTAIAHIPSSNPRKVSQFPSDVIDLSSDSSQPLDNVPPSIYVPKAPTPEPGRDSRQEQEFMSGSETQSFTPTATQVSRERRKKDRMEKMDVDEPPSSPLHPSDLMKRFIASSAPATPPASKGQLKLRSPSSTKRDTITTTRARSALNAQSKDLDANIAPPPPMSDILRSRLDQDSPSITCSPSSASRTVSSHSTTRGRSPGSRTSPARGRTSTRGTSVGLSMMVAAPEGRSERPDEIRSTQGPSSASPMMLRSRRAAVEDQATEGRPVDIDVTMSDGRRRGTQRQQASSSTGKSVGVNKGKGKLIRDAGTMSETDTEANGRKATEINGPAVDEPQLVRKHSSSPASLTTPPTSQEVATHTTAVPAGSGAKHPSFTRVAGLVSRSPRLNSPVASRKERELHIQSISKIPIEDQKKIYAPYKGRGRYAAQQDGGNSNGDAQYEIDKDQNNGIDQPYDEVVRDKAARKRMHAADCACCRDYYEAVGPLPARLAPPLWRSPSPSASPRKARRPLEGRRHRSASPVSPSRRQQQKEREIQDHRQQISRHRHHWQAANTPPDYWTIGFPDTQQLAEINDRAAQMHAQKRKYMEEEASKPNGRYKRKK